VGEWRSRNRDVYHACHAVDSGVMRRSEGAIVNLSSTGETITETATTHHRLHDPAAACRIMSVSSHEPWISLRSNPGHRGDAHD